MTSRKGKPGVRRCVFSTGNDAYIPKALVALLSFKKHNPDFDLFLLTARLSQQSQALCEACGVVALELDLGQAFFQEWNYPRECYFHFKGPEVFASMGYVVSVYLDGDTYCNRPLSVDTSESFHLAGVSYDTNRQFFTMLGEYDQVKSSLGITEGQGTERARIQSGVLVYNNDELCKLKYFEKVVELYARSIEKGLPRKGDDSLLSLALMAHPEIRTQELSKYYNLIDFQPETRTLPDVEVVKHSVVYHFVEQKPWFEGEEFFSDAHRHFVEKWREVLFNNFPPEETRRCFPGLFRELDLPSPDRVNFYWYSNDPPNFGDWITPYLVQRICGGKVTRSIDPTKTADGVIISTGSIMRLCGANTIVWGSGIRDRNQDIKPAKLFRSVRGPLTRERILEVGGKCPPIYGDPALLLPKVYAPGHIAKKHQLGIVPHVDQHTRVRELYKDEPGLTVVDLRTRDVERVVDQIIACEKIVSSSLHGIIVANAYGIPVRWIQFDTNIFGDNTKFNDHFASIGRPNESCIDALVYKKISPELLLENIESYSPQIDLDQLWDASIFHKGQVSPYIRYKLAEPAVS